MAATQFIVDVETLGVESTAVILSAAIIQFKLDEVPDWSTFLNRSMFVKFEVQHQVKNLKRTIEKSTMEWWGKQSIMVKTKSFLPGIYDLEASQGLDIIRGYAHLHEEANKNRGVTFWSRGALDQTTLESLAKAAGSDILIPYNNWRDIRTAVDLLRDDSNNGYCKVPGFDSGVVLKHDPVHDCCLDLMMLLSNNLPADVTE